MDSQICFLLLVYFQKYRNGYFFQYQLKVLEFGEKASKKVSATRRSIKKLKSKFLDQSSKAFNEGLKTKPSDFPLPKDLKLNFNPEIAKVKSSTMDMKPPCDVKRVPKECDSESYQDSLYSNQVKSIYTSDVKLPPRNVLFNETMPQPLLPPLSPSRSGAISLPARYKIQYKTIIGPVT